MLSLLPSILIALLASTASAQSMDPINDFCRRFGHQSAVIDSRLYIAGGYVDYGGSVSPSSQNYTNTYLLYSDLATTNDLNFPPQYANLTKPGFVPSVIGGTLWPDTINKKLYLWGGEYNWTTSPPATQRLWFYDVLYDVWNQTPAVIGSVQPASFGASAVDQPRGFAYYYGGWSSNATTLGFNGNPIAQPGLISYDMTNDLWTNISFIDNTPRAEGLLLYIPVSDSGMLVYFGGIQQTSNGSYTGAPMNQIHIFDIASGKTYSQTTSGTAPPMRRRFCGGASWPEDRSSYNIYLYGGNVPPDQQGMGYNDVWVLSIPSFTWTNYYNGSLYEHHSLSCNVINQGQMIILGGYFPNSTNTGCDNPGTYGQHNLDLGSVNVDGAQWYQYLPNVTTYEVPPNLTAVIGGSASGDASMTTPLAGFSDPDLSVYMTRKAPLTVRTATRDVSLATGQASSNGTSSGDTNVGAIAGGVVGGVAGLILLLLLLLLCLRRRRAAKRRAAAAGDPNNPHSAGGTFEHHRGPSEMAADSIMVEAPGHSTPFKHGAGSPTTTPSTPGFVSHYPKSSPQNPQDNNAWQNPPPASSHPSQRFHEDFSASPPMPQYPLPPGHQHQHQYPLPASPPLPYYPPPPAPQQHEEIITVAPAYEMATSMDRGARSPWRSPEVGRTIREE